MDEMPGRINVERCPWLHGPHDDHALFLFGGIFGGQACVVVVPGG